MRRSFSKNGGLGAWVIALAVGASVLAACGPSSEPSGDVGRGPASVGAIEIVADDKAFEPETLEVTSSDRVTVEIRNEDDMPHDFAIEDFELNTGTIEPGDAVTATFTVPEDGIAFVCTYHSGMTGRIEAL